MISHFGDSVRTPSTVADASARAGPMECPPSMSNHLQLPAFDCFFVFMPGCSPICNSQLFLRAERQRQALGSIANQAEQPKKEKERGEDAIHMLQCLLSIMRYSSDSQSGICVYMYKEWEHWHSGTCGGAHNLGKMWLQILPLP
jgi:hypothetical protein